MSKMFSKENKEAFLAPLNLNNPIAIQVLGICSALAVTSQLGPAIVMGLCVTVIVALSNVIVSLIRKTIPSRIRIIIQLVVVAALVTIVSILLKAVAYDVSVQLSGLWGAIWGYIALNSDLLTVYGVYFSHQSETAGLGARITEAEFQQQFVGKHISKPGSDKIDLAVVKNGKVQDPSVQCDGITGATLTSDGVSLMLQEGLANYRNFLHQKQKPTL